MAAVETLIPVEALVAQVCTASGVPPTAHHQLMPVVTEWVKRGWLGQGRIPGFERAWRALAPALYARNALDLLVPLGSGIYQLILARADIDLWYRRMHTMITATQDPEEILAAGKILAWLAGLAPYRSSALEHLAQFPAALAPLLWGGAHLPPRWQENLVHDPWYHPLRPWAPGLHGPWRIGGLQGTGGPFASIPTLVGTPWILQDSQGYWQLFADIWGARLVRTSAPTAMENTDSPFDLRGGHLRWQQHQAEWPELRAATGMQAQGDALLVTVPSGWLMLGVGRAQKGRKITR